MAQFRATVECDSPGQAAERLQAAGMTLLGPWASGSVEDARRLGLTGELDVTALLDERSSAAAADRVRDVLGAEVGVRVVEVGSGPPDGD